MLHHQGTTGMLRSGPIADPPATGVAGFGSTHWSVVLAAGGGAESEATAALERLYRTYAAPLYGYVRRQGHAPDAAMVIVQDLFLALVRKNQLASVSRAKGRFRSYLLACVNHLLANDWHQRHRLKRGGGEPTIALDALGEEARLGLEPVEARTPETLYERRWALALMEAAFARLAGEWQAQGKGALFDALRDSLSGDDEFAGHAVTAAALGMTEGAVRVAVHRLRVRFRDLVYAEIARTVSSPAEVEEEWQHLIGVLRG